jgi:hypothetical protein
MDIAEKTLQLKQDFDDVYEAGKKAGTVNEWDYDVFWDNLQQKGTRQHYANAFSYTGWNDTIYNPKYPITPTNKEGIASMLMWNQEITDTKVPITVYGKGQQAFHACKALKKIPKLIFNGMTLCTNMFYDCQRLEELYCEGVIDINGFDVHWSTLLSADSLKSIIEALSTSTTGLTITLPTTAQANYEAVYGSGSWNVLTATRSNWTIAYA